VVFPMATGLGLMGEKGPEAVMPLERVGDSLGVRALVPQPGPVQVTVNNNLGVEAQVDVQHSADGSLEINLEKKLADMVARGGDFQQALLAIFNINKRF